MKEKNKTRLSFYYWKTNFELDSIEQQSLTDLNVDKIYIRYFDVALKENLAVPVQPVLFNNKVPTDLSVVPVVYIKNEVLLNQEVSVSDLAKHIISFVKQINKKNNITPSEIQLDCDWTLNSKEKFFQLIAELKTQEGWRISSTIRLHQIKYASKTGIPDVDYGVLMYYNMGTIASDTLNSIYDRTIAKKYIGSLKEYPLKLNYALPIYSWLVHTRNGKVLKLISRVRSESLKDNDAFLAISTTAFEVTKECSYFGQHFKIGDKLKVENTTDAQLLEMVEDLRKATDNCAEEIILYDLNSVNIKVYEKETFEKLASCK